MKKPRRPKGQTKTASPGEYSALVAKSMEAVAGMIFANQFRDAFEKLVKQGGEINITYRLPGQEKDS